MSIFEIMKTYPAKKPKTIPILSLTPSEALEFLMQQDKYCTTELPEYFEFDKILDYVEETIGNKSIDECLVSGKDPRKMNDVNLLLIDNKDGKYGVRPLTLANPFLYYMLARDICEYENWNHIKECFKIYQQNPKIEACSIPQKRMGEKPEKFNNETAIIHWWNKIEQQSVELSLRYPFMFVTDITNCFGQINPDSINWALSLLDTPFATDKNDVLAKKIKRYLLSMQNDRNVGIPQGSRLFGFIAEIVLGYADLLLSMKIDDAIKEKKLSKAVDYKVLRYVDDYRIFCNDRAALKKISYLLQEVLENLNFRMNTSKTRISDDIVEDAIKPDKLYYVFNTPIEHSFKYKFDGKDRKLHCFDFAGFQKHLLFIYEFGRRYPNAGQLLNLLSAFDRRVESLLNETKKIKIKWETIDLEGSLEKPEIEEEEKELKRHLWENVPAMVAICVKIAEENIRAAHYALQVASRLLADMKPSDYKKRNELIELIYQKFKNQPNSAFLQLWLQNITHVTDKKKKDRYDMPLCKLVSNEKVDLWNNTWLKPELAENLPIQSIVNRKKLRDAGPIITFREKRQYDEMRED